MRSLPPLIEAINYKYTKTYVVKLTTYFKFLLEFITQNNMFLLCSIPLFLIWSQLQILFFPTLMPLHYRGVCFISSSFFYTAVISEKSHKRTVKRRKGWIIMTCTSIYFDCLFRSN